MGKEGTFAEALTAIITYGWIIAIAMLGGLVKFIRKLNESKEPKPLRYIFYALLGK